MLTNSNGIGSGLVCASGANLLKRYHCLRDKESATLLSKLNMCFALNITLFIISLKTKCLTNSITLFDLEDWVLMTLTSERLSTWN